MELLDRYLEVVRSSCPPSFQIGFIVTAVIVVIQIVKQLQRLKRATPMPPDSMAARAAR